MSGSGRACSSLLKVQRCCPDNKGDLDGVLIYRFSRLPQDSPGPFAFWGRKAGPRGCFCRASHALAAYHREDRWGNVHPTKDAGGVFTRVRPNDQAYLRIGKPLHVFVV